MSNTRRLVVVRRGIVLTGHARPIRNLHGKAILCCHGPCERDADDRFRVELPHNQPRWKDLATGKQEMLIYTFCSDTCKAEFLVNSPYADRS